MNKSMIYNQIKLNLVWFSSVELLLIMFGWSATMCRPDSRVRSGRLLYFKKGVRIVPCKNTFVLSAVKNPILTGLQVVIPGDIKAEISLTDTSIEVVHPIANDQLYNEKLCTLLMNICLEYPFWNNFRILDFFNKRGILMTMDELQFLRSECGLENREDVCLELMRLYFNNEIELGKKQLQFIERVNPVFRDRYFSAGRPGELLIYECVSLRRLNKMFYIHLIFDLFNGYSFGRVSQRRSGAIGIQLLQEKVVPLYRGRGYTIKAIVHSINSTRDHLEAKASNIREKALAMDIELLEPKHKFGIIQCFQREWVDPFFDVAEVLDVSLLMIQPAFDRWMIKYNAACLFHQRRNLLGDIDDSDGQGRMQFKSQYN